MKELRFYNDGKELPFSVAPSEWLRSVDQCGWIDLGEGVCEGLCRDVARRYAAILLTERNSNG
jgi:hypothetical protein